MRVFDKKNILYSELLTGIKLLIDENGNNSVFVSKEKVDEALDYLLNLKNKNEQNFLISGITTIDERMTNDFPKNTLYGAFHKLPVIVSLIRIIKEGNYQALKDFSPEECSTLAMVTWSATDELYPRIVSVYALKQMLDKILEKSDNIRDNFLLAIEAEKSAKINYKGDLKKQVTKLYTFLDNLDEKAIEKLLNKDAFRKK